jgi:antitoxin component YwqK of YwqJK toxin-antitoxin module
MRTSGMYANDKQVGVWRSWRQNGLQLEEKKYVDGVKEGPTARWQDNGAKEFDGTYKADAKDGTFNYYNKDAELIKTEQYNKGTLIGSKKVPVKAKPKP